MKLLYLVRHAKSSWKLDYLDDFERPLNKRGKRDAPLMGGVLREREVKPSIVLSSPAARAASTARIIAAEIGYPLDLIRYEEYLYEAGVRDFAEAIGNLSDTFDSAMIVSHDPGISMTANHFVNSSVEDIPTCGVVAIEFDVDSWRDVKEGKGTGVFFEYPKKYALNADEDSAGKDD